MAEAKNVDAIWDCPDCGSAATVNFCAHCGRVNPSLDEMAARQYGERQHSHQWNPVGESRLSCVYCSLKNRVDKPADLVCKCGEGRCDRHKDAILELTYAERTGGDDDY